MSALVELPRPQSRPRHARFGEFNAKCKRLPIRIRSMAAARLRSVTYQNALGGSPCLELRGIMGSSGNEGTLRLCWIPLKPPLPQFTSIMTARIDALQITCE